MKALLAELLGTFILVLAGTGAIVIHDTRGGVTHVGVSLVFGLVVLALILALARVSGCHINPAVTLAATLAGRFAPARVPGYLLAQCAGAVLASLLLRAMFPSHPSLGATLPAGEVWVSFVLEVLLTFLLMLVVLRLVDSPLETIALAVGAVIALEALFAGPECGASMNPARSLGPAVVSGKLQHLWLYLAAPVLGAALAVPVARLLPDPPKKEPAAIG